MSLSYVNATDVTNIIKRNNHFVDGNNVIDLISVFGKYSALKPNDKYEFFRNQEQKTNTNHVHSFCVEDKSGQVLVFYKWWSDPKAIYTSQCKVCNLTSSDVINVIGQINQLSLNNLYTNYIHSEDNPLIIEIIEKDIDVKRSYHEKMQSMRNCSMDYSLTAQKTNIVEDFETRKLMNEMDADVDDRCCKIICSVLKKNYLNHKQTGVRKEEVRSLTGNLLTETEFDQGFLALSADYPILYSDDNNYWKLSCIP